jgi:hypothetical protein
MVAPGVGVRAQAVVDVERVRLQSVRVREVQQHHRIEAAAKGDRDGRHDIGMEICAQGRDGLRELGGNGGRPLRTTAHSSRGVVSLNLP